MSSDQFKKAEDEYFRLKGQLAAGRITREQFESALKDLMVQDGQGRYWVLGPDSAEWYVHDGQNWVQAQPPQGLPSVSIGVPPPLPPPKAKPRNWSLAILATGGLGILCLLSVIALLLASSKGILKTGFNPTSTPVAMPIPIIPLPMTPTFLPSPTTTPPPSTTATATTSPMPTPTATVTVTPSATLRPEGNCADPNARWENVVDGQTVDPYAVFIGTANAVDFTGYVIEWLRPGNVLHRSTTPVIHGVLFVWNTYTVPNGEYPVALIVVLNDGSTLAPCVVRVRVAH